MKSTIWIGIIIAFIVSLSSLDTALAEKESTITPVDMAIHDNMTVQDNMTMSQKIPMPMCMPMDIPMSMPIPMNMQGSTLEFGSPTADASTSVPMPTNIIIVQNVTLNIITILNMTVPNAIQPYA